ncbi:twin-arginine translocase TatA/TatE family subunit [Agrococcus sp. SGAir0287]|uniref:twin-arginine translocase TatA/TatE family subunit n=1 Tax=Agrococcus sp. SGAir0287 TaxID=2070347 RepID=UPI0010CD3900|nr:twin-arginine translocase TatA/TatE family subunit [Agrococcus sp. SGAir0287]QCR19213.1 twin-arginine translocase TatA/TatE family subunit [Agrococcus sp. SGAir0287]
MGGFAGNLASHWWVILIIVLLIFGATRLPQLAKGVGESINVFKREVKKDAPADGETTTTTSSDTRDSK